MSAGPVSPVSIKQREGWPRAFGIGLALALVLLVFARTVATPLTNAVSDRVGLGSIITANEILARGWPAYLFMVFLGISMGGFFEELVFRRRLIEWVNRAMSPSILTWPAAILLSATVDGLAHLPFWGTRTVVFSFQMFLVLGTAYVVLRRDVRPLIVAHATYDVTVLTRIFFGV